jgi:hypothetical protein
MTAVAVYCCYGERLALYSSLFQKKYKVKLNPRIEEYHRFGEIRRVIFMSNSAMLVFGERSLSRLFIVVMRLKLDIYMASLRAPNQEQGI